VNGNSEFDLKYTRALLFQAKQLLERKHAFIKKWQALIKRIPNTPQRLHFSQQFGAILQEFSQLETVTNTLQTVQEALVLLPENKDVLDALVRKRHLDSRMHYFEKQLAMTLRRINAFRQRIETA